MELTLEDFDRISRKFPIYVTLRPSANMQWMYYPANGGVPAVLKTIENKLDDQPSPSPAP